MVHLYIGKGKGKTTAALGLILRAAGFGKRVYFAQFLKSATTESGELNALKKGKLNITIKKFTDQVHPLFFKKGAFDKKKLKSSIDAALEKVLTIMRQGRYDVIVLDEILNALTGGFCSKTLLKQIIARAAKAELILTGRDAPADIIARADYVSRINKVKHPFDRGVLARRGIEY